MTIRLRKREYTIVISVVYAVLVPLIASFTAMTVGAVSDLH